MTASRPFISFALSYLSLWKAGGFSQVRLVISHRFPTWTSMMDHRKWRDGSQSTLDICPWPTLMLSSEKLIWYSSKEMRYLCYCRSHLSWLQAGLKIFLLFCPLDSPSDCINNLNNLRDYLREQEEEENKLQRGITN